MREATDAHGLAAASRARPERAERVARLGRFLPMHRGPLAGGIDPPPGEPEIPPPGDRTAFFDRYPALRWYDEMARQPPTLQHISRCSVRGALGADRMRAIHTLGIPTQLKKYLLLDFQGAFEDDDDNNNNDADDADDDNDGDKGKGGKGKKGGKASGKKTGTTTTSAAMIDESGGGQVLTAAGPPTTLGRGRGCLCGVDGRAEGLLAGEPVMEEMDEGEAVIVLEDDYEVETIVIEEEEEIMEMRRSTTAARDEVGHEDAASAAAANDDDNALPSVLVELTSWEDL